jgi:hypothetical protein
MIKVKTTYLLHTTFVVIFIISFYHSIISFLECYRIEQVEKYDIDAVYFSLSYYQNYRTVLFQLLPIIGIILKKRIGWIFFTSYIYYFQINIITQNQVDINKFSILASLIVLIVLFLLNTRKSIISYYNISFEKSLNINALSLLLGASLSYLLIQLKQ